MLMGALAKRAYWIWGKSGLWKSGAVPNSTIGVNLGIFCDIWCVLIIDAAETPYQKPPTGLGFWRRHISTQMPFLRNSR